jgi:hypothetical protein
MTAEQIEAIMEWVDGERAAGRRWDEIEERIEGQIPEELLNQLESMHRRWARGRLNERLAKEEREEELDGDRVAADPGRPSVALRAESSGAGVIEFLAWRLIGRQPRAGDVRWGRTTEIVVPAGHELEIRKGPGEAAGQRWWVCAVLLIADGKAVRVWPEARVRCVLRAGTAWMERKKYRTDRIRLQFLSLDEERLNAREISHRVAALLHAYLGSSTGIRSNVELARLTGTTRQNISQMKQRVAAKHYEATGGLAGFEGMQSARRIRDRVRKKANAGQEGGARSGSGEGE